METWAAFFGPPPDGSADADAIGPVPEAYHGANAFLGELVRQVVTDEPIALLRDVLPWRAGPRDGLPRYGIVSMLEHGFAQSETGRSSYAQVIANVRDTILQTALADGITALLDAVPARPAPAGLSDMIEVAREAGVQPNVLIVPDGVDVDTSAADAHGIRVERLPSYNMPGHQSPAQPLLRDGALYTVLTVTGGATGCTAYDGFECQVAENTMTPAHLLQITVYMKSKVTQPQNVFVFRTDAK